MAILKIFDDMVNSVANGQATFLCLLDLAVTFDTVDHNILLHYLKSCYGLNDSVHTWFSSYLTDMTRLS